MSRNIRQRTQLPHPGPWLSCLSGHLCHLGESFILTKCKHHPDKLLWNRYTVARLHWKLLRRPQCAVEDQEDQQLEAGLRRGREKNGEVGAGDRQTALTQTEQCVSPDQFPAAPKIQPSLTPPPTPHPPNTACRALETFALPSLSVDDGQQPSLILKWQPG